MFYAGIGSRETPKHILDKMTELAAVFRRAGYILNSGGAPGADQAFEAGALDYKQIFVPWNNFSGKKMHFDIPDECYDIASKLHPAWERLKPAIRSLMARNVMQVLGFNLKEPVDFVLCWTPDGCTCHADRNSTTGGTGLAISVADKYNVPIFNLADPFHYYYVTNILIKELS